MLYPEQNEARLKLSLDGTWAFALGSCVEDQFDPAKPLPVSYTHLDVYKRQMLRTSTPYSCRKTGNRVCIAASPGSQKPNSTAQNTLTGNSRIMPPMPASMLSLIHI